MIGVDLLQRESVLGFWHGVGFLLLNQRCHIITEMMRKDVSEGRNIRPGDFDMSFQPSGALDGLVDMVIACSSS